MHPNAFLKTFWRLEVKPQIFVAMSFAPEYQARYDKVIAPTIASLQVNGIQLEPYRVDISKSGDSILTDIVDNVSHSQMILADVSTVGKDSKTGGPYRNGNVMYEVGIALACRNPSDVLLVRDDKDNFLFDVSTVPHMHLDFTDHGKAKAALQAELLARLREQSYLADARVKLAVTSLSNPEVGLLSQLAELPEGKAKGWNVRGALLSLHEAALMRLLDKRLVTLVGKFDKGCMGYQLTPLGRIVSEIAKSRLPEFQGKEDSEKKANENQSTADDVKPA